MTLAKEINEKLDKIIELKEELHRMETEVPADAVLTNKDTGDEMSLEDAVSIAYGVLRRIKEDLNQITNDGKNVKNIFDNQFYINDMIQDKVIAEEINSNKIINATTSPNKPVASANANPKSKFGNCFCAAEGFLIAPDK